MARISTYNNASPVSLSDKFIGTNVTGSPANATKNFLVSDLLSLFQDNITLQNVLDAGDTATQDINLTGNISLDGGNLTLDATTSLYVNGLLIDSGGATGTLGQTLKADASGKPVWGVITLQNVLDAGDTAVEDINLTGNIRLDGGDLYIDLNSALNCSGTLIDSTGATGALGQTLTSDASGKPVWGAGGGGSQNLEQVLAVGNTATNNINLTGNITQTGDIGLTGDITQTGNIGLTGDITHAGAYSYSGGQFTMAATGTMVLGGALTCNSSISLTGSVKDYNDTLGGDGEALISDASGQVTWQDVSTLPSICRFSASTSFNLLLINQGGVLIMTGAGATDVNVPDNATVAFPTGTKITIIQEGAGQITLVPTAGVTVNSAVGLKFASTNSVAHIVKVDTDKWYAYGDLTP